MRHLDRTAVTAPACLSRFSSGTHHWDDLSWDDREQIRAQLGILQRRCCAYCECDIEKESKEPHVEHFIQRRRAAHLIFDWHNLFWSCSHDDRCGKNKDKPATAYADQDLLKPDVDDPRRFLVFLSDGCVRPRVGLSAAERRRAETTI